MDDLSRVDSRIESARELLGRHVSPVILLSAVGNATLKTVRFSNFNYAAPAGQDITLHMSGQAKSFMSLALQQAEFAKPENKQYFKNPIFSDFSLDKDGNVTFSFSSVINPDLVLFGADLRPHATSSPSSASSTPSRSKNTP